MSTADCRLACIAGLNGQQLEQSACKMVFTAGTHPHLVAASETVDRVAAPSTDGQQRQPTLQQQQQSAGKPALAASSAVQPSRAQQQQTGTPSVGEASLPSFLPRCSLRQAQRIVDAGLAQVDKQKQGSAQHTDQALLSSISDSSTRGADTRATPAKGVQTSFCQGRPAGQLQRQQPNPFAAHSLSAFSPRGQAHGQGLAAGQPRSAFGRLQHSRNLQQRVLPLSLQPVSMLADTAKAHGRAGASPAAVGSPSRKGQKQLSQQQQAGELIGAPGGQALARLQTHDSGVVRQPAQQLPKQFPMQQQQASRSTGLLSRTPEEEERAEQRRQEEVAFVHAQRAQRLEHSKAIASKRQSDRQLQFEQSGFAGTMQDWEEEQQHKQKTWGDRLHVLSGKHMSSGGNIQHDKCSVHSTSYTPLVCPWTDLLSLADKL